MTLEELKKYVTSNKRICPMPPEWAKIGEIIKIKPGHPCTPLILNGWVFSSDQEKRERLIQQIEYAYKDKKKFYNLENFILKLKDIHWYKG
jgi:hypothetical protein